MDVVRRTSTNRNIWRTMQDVQGRSAHAHDPRAVWEVLGSEEAVAQVELCLLRCVQIDEDLHLEEHQKRVVWGERKKREDPRDLNGALSAVHSDKAAERNAPTSSRSPKHEPRSSQVDQFHG